MSSRNVVWLAPEQLAEIKAAYVAPTIEPIAVSREHAAILLDCSVDTIDSQIKKGNFKAFYINSLLRITVESLKKYAGVK